MYAFSCMPLLVVIYPCQMNDRDGREGACACHVAVLQEEGNTPRWDVQEMQHPFLAIKIAFHTPTESRDFSKHRDLDYKLVWRI